MGWFLEVYQRVNNYMLEEIRMENGGVGFAELEV